MAWWNPKHLVIGPDGNLSQARVWTNIGKGACVSLLYKHAETLITNPESMLILLGFLILPQLVERIINARYGAPNGTAEPARK